MCKWQMDYPEARVKSSLSDCTSFQDLSMDLSSRLSMDLSSRHLRTYEAKRTEEHLYYFSLFYFISFSFSLFLFYLSSFCFLLFFSSHHIFFSFFIFFLLQHNTYIAFVRDDVMIPPPCLNDARPRAQMRGEMTAKVSINSIILQNI
jgi:cellulose synthase/poly-beta-1,6-N-acetylglucosamine synthase-like glycosyltransferase